MISDYAARERALDANRSFIVQAPAGSGKTGLLVYRILVLLATVERPEQVLAITFTRKATSEMRQRLIELLMLAETKQVSEDVFEQQGIDLAAQVLAQDKRYSWNLLNTPNQLQIQTIDAFCGKLAGAMPWLSRLGDKPRTTDNAEPHYAAAIEQLLNELLGEPSDLSTDLQSVLLSLDFNYSRARRLFNAMLGRRDQWLRHLLRGDLAQMRNKIQASWCEIRDAHLSKLSEMLPSSTILRLCDIAVHAASQIELKSNVIKSPLAAFEIHDTNEPLNYEKWVALQFLLQTDKGDFRKRLTKHEGCPAGKQPHKVQLQELLAEFVDDDELKEAIYQVKSLPDGDFTDQDWQQLLALENVLKSLAGLLQLRFRSMGECDHSEVTQRANLALEELNNPTDLALRLDYQINHILVDEFQDTSYAQLQLLKRLTAGWEEATENRSLFLVGDPMQSIYRFREADVGLFLQVADNRSTRLFDNVEIEPLVLTENFRSTSYLVDWFNQTFKQSFPQQNQVLNGAICYAEATSNKLIDDTKVITRLVSDKQQEAEAVVLEIQQALNDLPSDKKVAVLVRSRSHLKSLLPAMQNAEISYAAVDIQPLQEAQAIIDVLSLCKAISRLDDRISWLALLRGPWCGLTLTQIKQLVPLTDMPIWLQLDKLELGALGHHFDYVIRLSRFIDVMRHAIEQRQQLALHSITRWAWKALGGENTLYGISLDDVQAVFDLIENYQKGGDLISDIELDKGLDGLFAQAQHGDDVRVVVSTMHKSKGLQYDTVILPCLDRKPPTDQKDILMWAEHQNDQGQAKLLLAPISTGTADKQTGNNNQHYEYLRSLEQRRASNESIRLMYVAATRAERNLVLIACANLDQKTELVKAPDKRSLIGTVWGALQNDFSMQANLSVSHVDKDVNISQDLSRIPSDYKVSFENSVAWQAEQQLQSQDDEFDESEIGELEFEWATEMATAVGIVMHEWLQFHHAKLFDDNLAAQLATQWHQQWRSQLMALHVPSDRIRVAVNRLIKGVERMCKDENAHFLFAEYAIQKNEFALAAYENGVVNNYRIDRTFVDNEGCRWIVDYKTTYTQAEDVSAFVDEQIELRHRAQLQKYASLMRSIDKRPIKLAVYFPILGELRSWQYQG